MYTFLAIFSALLVVAIHARPEEQYTTKYDGINLQDVLNNKRLLTGYTNCLLEKGSCSPDGSELKRVLPEALENGCAKCSEKHRNGAKLVLGHLIDHERETYDELEKKYDPSGEYRKKYEEQAKKEGIKL